jgi:hypothetical protein
MTWTYSASVASERARVQWSNECFHAFFWRAKVSEDVRAVDLAYIHKDFRWPRRGNVQQRHVIGHSCYALAKGTHWVVQHSEHALRDERTPEESAWQAGAHVLFPVHIDFDAREKRLDMSGCRRELVHARWNISIGSKINQRLLVGENLRRDCEQLHRTVSRQFVSSYNVEANDHYEEFPYRGDPCLTSLA